MTTEDYMEQLRSLTASTLQDNQARSDSFRPEGRWPLTDFEADTKISIEKRSGVSQKGEPWANKVICLHLTNIKINETYRGKPCDFTDGEYDISLPADIKKAGTGSQLGLTVAALAETAGPSASFPDLDGKRVHYVEAVKPAPRDANGAVQKARDGYNLRPIFYYKPTIMGAKANGAKPDSHAANLALLAFAVGKSPEAFRLNAAPYLASQGLKDDALQLKVLNGQWLIEAETAGKLSLVDNAYVLLEIPAGAQ